MNFCSLCGELRFKAVYALSATAKSISWGIESKIKFTHTGQGISLVNTSNEQVYCSFTCQLLVKDAETKSFGTLVRLRLETSSLKSSKTLMLLESSTALRKVCYKRTEFLCSFSSSLTSVHGGDSAF